MRACNIFPCLCTWNLRNCVNRTHASNFILVFRELFHLNVAVSLAIWPKRWLLTLVCFSSLNSTAIIHDGNSIACHSSIMCICTHFFPHMFRIADNGWHQTVFKAKQQRTNPMKVTWNCDSHNQLQIKLNRKCDWFCVHNLLPLNRIGRKRFQFTSVSLLSFHFPNLKESVFSKHSQAISNSTLCGKMYVHVYWSFYLLGGILLFSISMATILTTSTHIGQSSTSGSALTNAMADKHWSSKRLRSG